MAETKERLPYQEVIDELREEAQSPEDHEYLDDQERELGAEREKFEDARNKQPAKLELTESGGVVLTDEEVEKIQKGEDGKPTPYGDTGRRS